VHNATLDKKYDIQYHFDHILKESIPSRKRGDIAQNRRNEEKREKSRQWSRMTSLFFLRFEADAGL